MQNNFRKLQHNSAYVPEKSWNPFVRYAISYCISYKSIKSLQTFNYKPVFS